MAHQPTKTMIFPFMLSSTSAEAKPHGESVNAIFAETEMVIIVMLRHSVDCGQLA